MWRFASGSWLGSSHLCSFFTMLRTSFHPTITHLGLAPASSLLDSVVSLKQAGWPARSVIFNEAHKKDEVPDEKDLCPRLFRHFHSIRARVCGSGWFHQLGRLVAGREQRSEPAGHADDWRRSPGVSIHRRDDGDRRQLFEQLDCGKVLGRWQRRTCDLRLYLQGQLQRHVDSEWSDAGDQRLHLPAL